MSGRRRAAGFAAVIAGLVLAALVAWQTASLAAFEIWAYGVEGVPAVLYALAIGGGLIVGAGLLVAGGIETLRGVRWWRSALAAALVVTVMGWAAVPLLVGSLRPLLEEDAHDVLRFRHSLHFSGDLTGDLVRARFSEGTTCTATQKTFALWQVRGAVGDRQISLWISVDPYGGPGTYRVRHQPGNLAGSDPGVAELVFESEEALSGGYVKRSSWYGRSGSITVDPGGTSGSVDEIAGTPPWQKNAEGEHQTRVSGTWACIPGAQ
jgi:hypothetical protein